MGQGTGTWARRWGRSEGPEMRDIGTRPESGSTLELVTESLSAEPSADIADADAQEPEVGPTSASVEGADSHADLLSDFAQAMHDAADARRAQTLEAVELRRAVHVQTIRERGADESVGLRAQSEHDVAGIEAWAEAEIERIHAERERRNEARQRELDALLDRHDAQIEWEIESIEAAVASHRSELDTFFTRLGTESDVTIIARLAQNVPQLPDLEGISAAARARAAVGRSSAGLPSMARVAEIDEAPAAAAGPAEAPSDLGDEDEAVDEDRLIGVIGVMDPAAPTRSSEMDFGDRPLEPVAESRPPEPVAEVRTTSGQLLHAIPALRPVAAWLNHGNGNEQDEKKSE